MPKPFNKKDSSWNKKSKQNDPFQKQYVDTASGLTINSGSQDYQEYINNIINAQTQSSSLNVPGGLSNPTSSQAAINNAYYNGILGISGANYATSMNNYYTQYSDSVERKAEPIINFLTKVLQFR